MTLNFLKVAAAMFCLCFSLTAHSQSEQETLTWLSEKLTTYLKPHGGVYGGVGFTNLKVVKVEPCAITLTFEQKNLTRNKLFYTATLVLPTAGIKINDRGLIEYGDQVIEYTTVSAVAGATPKTKYLNGTADIFVEEKEKDFIVKLQNGMHHAATFCTKDK
jgi:hypothetical protein